MKTDSPRSPHDAECYWPFHYAAKACTAVAAVLSLCSGIASAGLVLEVKPSDYDTAALKWPIAAGTMKDDYFACAPWAPVKVATKVNAGDGLSYKAVDFTTAGSILGGPLCPASLGGANPKTIEAWCFQPTGANGDAQTLIDLSRQYGPDNTNFAFCNSMYNRSIWSLPYIEGWNASNAVRSGRWVHLVASYDGATLNLYVDGAPDRTGIAHTFATEAGGSISIGMMRYGFETNAHSTDKADGWNAYRGYMGSIRVYDEARTASQVSADYALGVNYGEVGVGQPKITASVTGSGGTISPTGVVYVVPGNNQSFTFTPSLGFKVQDVLVDSVSNSAAVLAGSYTFETVAADHTIAVSFEELPPQTVSGKVTDGTTGIMGAKVYFKTSANASVNPVFTTNTMDAAGNYSINLPPGNWYVTASEIHYYTPSDATFTIAAAPVAVPDIVLTANPNWKILFAVNTDEFSALSDGARIQSWNSYPAYTTYNNEAPLLGPTVEVIDGVKWEKNVRAPYNDTVSPTVHDRGDGFNLGSHPSGIVTEGVTIIAVVKPEYKTLTGEPRGEVVDIFYGELFLAVNHGNGEVMVCTRGYDQKNTGYFIPNGQKTILSLVVTPTGGVTLFANGVQKWSYASGADYTSLKWYGTFDKITIGRNGYDGWSTFNGNIGDVNVYRVALDDATRETVQTSLATKFGITLPTFHTITASAGPNGSISPSGACKVEQGTDQIFTITANSGFVVKDVLVDGVSEGSIPSYTFPAVIAPHTISATFAAEPVGTGYATWISQWFVLGEPAAEKTADPDGDGRNNLLEYALDDEPNSAVASGKVRSRIEDVDGEQAMLITLPVLNGSTNFAGLTAKSNTVGSVVYTIEGTNGLDVFDQVVSEVIPARAEGMVAPFSGWTYRTFRLNGAVPTRGSAGFLRVRVAEAIP